MFPSTLLDLSGKFPGWLGGRGGWRGNWWPWCLFLGQKAKTADMTCILTVPQCHSAWPEGTLSSPSCGSHSCLQKATLGLVIRDRQACWRKDWHSPHWWRNGLSSPVRFPHAVMCLFVCFLQISALPGACKLGAISRVPWAGWVNSQAIAVCWAESLSWFMASLE